MFRFAVFMVVVVLVGVGRVSADPVGLIVNGGFESPQISAGYETFRPPPFPQIPGWTIVDGSVDLVREDVFGAPFEGAQFMDLNGSRPGTIEQAFTTTAGLPYRVSFRYASNTSAAVSSTSGLISVSDGDGELMLHESFTHGRSTPDNMDYSIFEGDFVANGETAVLRFESTSFAIPASGPALDAVSFSLIPEPSTLALLGMGTVGLFCYIWRRRKPAAGGVMRSLGPGHSQ